MKKLMCIIFIMMVSMSVSCKKSILDQKVHSLLKKLAPEPQMFRLDPSQQNSIITEKGARFIIPQDTFDLPEKLLPGDTIEVKVIEAYSSFELATSGVSLQYTMPGGSTAWFESAGMFSFTASYKEKKLKFAKGKKVTVKFPNVQPCKKFNVYYVKNGQWVYHGHNQESKTSISISMPLTKKEKKLMKAYERGNQVITAVGTRIYEIDNPGWYNFDYPNNKTACAKGTINVENKKEGNNSYYITALGIDHRGYFSFWSYENAFRMNLFKNKTYTFIIVDNFGNVGVAKKITIWDKTGLERSKDLPCMDIGSISLKKIKDDIVKDRKKFLNYIGISEERFVPEANRGKYIRY